MGTPGCPCGPDGIETWRVATGILRISTVKLASTARRISVEQEHHPHNFALFAFDGIGPLLAAELVRELGIPGLVASSGSLQLSRLRDVDGRYGA